MMFFIIFQIFVKLLHDGLNTLQNFVLVEVVQFFVDFSQPIYLT